MLRPNRLLVQSMLVLSLFPQFLSMVCQKNALLTFAEYKDKTRIVIPLAPSFEGRTARDLLLPEGKTQQIPCPPQRARNDNLLSLGVCSMLGRCHYNLRRSIITQGVNC